MLFEELKDKVVNGGKYSQDHYTNFETYYFEQMQKDLIMKKTKL